MEKVTFFVVFYVIYVKIIGDDELYILHVSSELTIIYKYYV